MLCHDVFFTLVDRSPEAVERLLGDHPGVVYFSVGTLEPDLDRDVNDRGFDVALHVVFADRASHDVYQTAPDHLRFIEENHANWAQVRVFDSTVDGGPLG
jgi:hypothetical protein